MVASAVEAVAAVSAVEAVEAVGAVVAVVAVAVAAAGKAVLDRICAAQGTLNSTAHWLELNAKSASHWANIVRTKRKLKINFRCRLHVAAQAFHVGYIRCTVLASTKCQMIFALAQIEIYVRKSVYRVSMHRCL